MNTPRPPAGYRPRAQCGRPSGIDDLSQRGDDPPHTPGDHGTVANNAAWTNQGMRLNRTFQCNTWLASPERVQ